MNLIIKSYEIYLIIRCGTLINKDYTRVRDILRNIKIPAIKFCEPTS